MTPLAAGYSDSVTGSNVTVGTASVVVLKANPRRSYALLVNDSDTVIYLALGPTAVLNKGVRINAFGGSYEINDTNLYRGDISAIASAATKILCTTEGESDYVPVK